MPNIDMAQYASMPPNDLEQLRRSIITKAAGSHDNLELEDLHTLAAITAVLRRRASGPPKAAKAPSSRAKPTKASVDDLA